MSKHYKVTDEFREFCKQLSVRRLAAGSSQTEVAEAIESEQAVVSRIERGSFGDTLREEAYALVSAYGKLYGVTAPVLSEGLPAARAPAIRVTRNRRAPVAAPKASDTKFDATATILRLVADGTIPPEVAGIVIKALAS